MRGLKTHSAIGWLYRQDNGAWGLYVACRLNPEIAKQIAALATDEQRELIRQAYDEDAKYAATSA